MQKFQYLKMTIYKGFKGNVMYGNNNSMTLRDFDKLFFHTILWFLSSALHIKYLAKNIIRNEVMSDHDLSKNMGLNGFNNFLR